MSDPMAGLDAWLEAPYVDAERRQDEFERWCELTGVDPEGGNAWDEYEDAQADE